MSITTILIIGFALLSIISSASKKAKESAAQQQSKSRQFMEQPNPFFIFDDKEEEEKDVREELMRKEAPSSTHIPPVKVPHYEKDLSDNSNEHNTKLEIDPTKLVIYSEIMKPKWSEF